MNMNKLLFFGVILSITFQRFCLAAGPATYNHESKVALFETNTDLGAKPYLYDSALYMVDFENKEVEVLIRLEGVNSLAVSYDDSIVAIASKRKIVFISLADRKILLEKSGWFDAVKWSPNSNVAQSSNYLFDLTNLTSTKYNFSGRVVDAKWVNDSVVARVQTGDYLFKYLKISIDGGVSDISDVVNINESPNGRYFYLPVETEDSAFVDLYETSNGNPNLKYRYEVIGAPNNAFAMWGEGGLRLFGDYGGALIDLDTGELSRPSHDIYYGDMKRPLNRPLLQDLAADRERYVLMWNKEKKQFEVEDVVTGDIVRIYEKFW